MIQVTFLTAVCAVMQIFLMGAVGYVLVKKGAVKVDGLKLLSWISVNVAFPLFIFNQLLTHFDPVKQPLWWSFPLINIGLGFTGLMLGWLFTRIIAKGHQRQWMAVSGFHNAGYIPLLLATTLSLGQLTSDVYSCIILSIIGFDLCLWTIGVWLITNNPKGIRLQSFFTPPLISMFAAFIVVLIGAKGFFPELILKPIKIMGDSALALAMITIGGNLALTRFTSRGLGEVFGAVGVKLLVMPLLALLLLTFVKMPTVFGFILIVQSCMPTAITLSIIARHHDSEDQDFINQTIFYTHLLSAMTIPLFLGFYGMLIK